MRTTRFCFDDVKASRPILIIQPHLQIIILDCGKKIRYFSNNLW